MKNIFGEEIVVQPTGQKNARIARNQYRQLISIYGTNEKKKCKSCAFCIQHSAGSKKFYKCHKAKVGGPSTDWNSTWFACGLFEKKVKKTN